MRLAPALAALVLLAPIALADATQTAVLPAGPRVLCAVVLTDARSASQALRCDVTASAANVDRLVLRIHRAGHAWAYVDGAPVNGVTPQYAVLDCADTGAPVPPGTPDPSRSSLAWTCARAFAGGIATDTFHLIAFVDGPAGVAIEASIE